MSGSDYQRVEQAILYLEQNFRRQPRLADVARSVHLSEYHFQRLFRRWAGISPKRFLQFLTVEYAKARLEESRPVLEVAYAAGLSGPGRLHDLLVTTEGLTPGEHRRRGEGVKISYGVHESPFGPALLAATERGICSLAFLDARAGDGDAGADGALAAVGDLRERWSGAELREAPEITGPLAKRVFSSGEGAATPLALDLRGTNFQLRVWEGLLQLPPGHLVSYGELASHLGAARSARAVAAAVARNPVGWIIPCHRVIRGVGTAGGYRWGTPRKRAMLGWEAARSAG